MVCLPEIGQAEAARPGFHRAATEKAGEMGHDQAIAAINESIANGWHGIFPPKTKMPEAAPAQQQEVEKW